MTVAIVRTKEASHVRRAVELLGGMERFVARGDGVVVKPNVCAGKDSSTGTVTDPEMVAEVCRMVAECGGEPVVAESPIYPFSAARVFKRTGYGDFESRYGFPMVDIDKAESREVQIPEGRAIDHSVISDTVLKADRLINMPVLKTHFQTVVTLGLKNMKGVVVGKQKHLIHISGLDQGIVDLNTLVRSDLTIIDGIIGMEGMGGPTNGRTAEMDVIVAGDNVVETDAAGVMIMGGDPRRVKHIKLAASRGLGSLEGFQVLGESLESVSTRRDLPRLTGVSQLLVSGIAMRSYNLFRNPLMRLTGGQRVKKRVLLGELLIDEEKCDGCRVCIPACPVDALSFEDVLACDRKACIRCFCCAEVCPVGALSRKV